MSQKISPRLVKEVSNQQEGYVIKIVNGEAKLVQVSAGGGDSNQVVFLDSDEVLDLIKNYVSSLPVSIIADSSTSVNLGSDSFNINRIYLSDSGLYFDSTQIYEDGESLIINAKTIKPVDSDFVNSVIDSDYIVSKAPNSGGDGPRGIQGPQGSTGIAGDLGGDLQGVQGFQGTFGFRGSKGFEGTRGTQGLAGVGDPNSLAGAQGADGAGGAQGVRGEKGLQGIQGECGFSLQGITGPKGNTGPQGFDGADAEPGEQGVQGFCGFNGLVGDQGDQGYQGYRGDVGPNGNTGLRGISGYSIDGSTGDTGAQGAQGAQGIQGVVGPSATNLDLTDLCDGVLNSSNNVVIGSNISTNNVRGVAIGNSVQCTHECAVSIGFCSVSCLRGVSIGSRTGAIGGAVNGVCAVSIGYYTKGDLGIGSVAIGDAINTCSCFGKPKNCNVYIGSSILHRATSNIISFNGDNVFIGNDIITQNACRNVQIGSFLETNCSQRSVTIGHAANYDTFRNIGNVAIGAYSAYLTAYVDCSVVIGLCAGAKVTGLQACPSYSDMVFLGHKSGVSAYQYGGSNSTYLGGACAFVGSCINTIVLGTQSTSRIRANVQTISSLSDCRDKTNIDNIPYGLDFINSMRPVEFCWNRRDGIIPEKKIDIGFIAQELQDVELQFCSSEYTQLVDGDSDQYSADMMRTYPIVINAVQELQKQINRLKADFQSIKLN